MLDKEVFAVINDYAFYNIIWMNIFFVIVCLRIIIPSFNDKVAKFDATLSEVPPLPLIILHTVSFIVALYRQDYLSVLLFLYWGPLFFVVAYWYLQIKLYKIKFNWKPFGLISSYLCKSQYVIFMIIYYHYEMYETIYLFSFWVMYDQVYLIWFHQNADRSRRVTEDYWIFRISYPVMLFIPLLYNTTNGTYLLILSLILSIIWIFSLYKIISDGNFRKRPNNLEYLRNIVYLSSIYQQKNN